MNDSERHPNEREDERRNVEDVGHVAANVVRAREAVRAMGWPESVFMTDHLYESELTHARHDGLGVAVSVWDEVKGAHPNVPLTCEVMNEEKALHVLGVPAPGEVPGLLGQYADITESINDGPRKYRVNLETGEVLTERKVESLLKPLKKITTETLGDRLGRTAAQNRLDTYLVGTLPVLDASGWKPQGVHLGLAGSEDRIVAYHWDDEGGEPIRVTLLITHNGASYCVERPSLEGRVEGNLAPGVSVPTPQEARELYFGH